MRGSIVALGVALASLVLFARCSDGGSAPPATVSDASDEVALQCREASTGDAAFPVFSTALPAACALPAQECDPIGQVGCGANQACDLSRLGDFACAPAGAGTAGASCDAAAGPYCAAGLTCAHHQCTRLCCADSDCAGSACEPLRAMQASGGHVGACTLAGDAGATDAGLAPVTIIANHPGVFEGRGFLLPWAAWGDVLARELSWYATSCSAGTSGYPKFATAVHLDGACTPTIDDAIPAMQDATGIISYVKVYRMGNRADASMLHTARALADYLIDQASTPAGGAWPYFPRSTGKALAVPQAPDCGTQKDNPYDVEPDKGAMAGHAYMLLFSETKDPKYELAALRIAQALVANTRPADAQTAPWPFRVDYRTGAGHGEVNSNLSYALRLFDELLPNHPELQKPRDQLWAFIKTLQIPSITQCGGQLWGQFFEDASFDPNRNAWAPLSLARYLIERREALDPDWKADVKTLLDWVEETFVDLDDQSGYRLCIEQDFDRKPFGGILSTYAAVHAMWAKETGSTFSRLRAFQALTILEYGVDTDGCPKDQALKSGRGGWQEDAHTDKVHNLVDAFTAFPEWMN